MNNLVMGLRPKLMLELLGWFPELWWKDAHSDLQSLIGFLHGNSRHESLLRHVQSTGLAIQQWVQRRREKVENSTPVPPLINCTMSTERLVTISIPITFNADEEEEFYIFRFQPKMSAKVDWVVGAEVKTEDRPKRLFEVTLHHAGEGRRYWWGNLGGWLVHKAGLIGAEDKVVLDGIEITAKAFNVLAAINVAMGTDDPHPVFFDMAQDGEL